MLINSDVFCLRSQIFVQSREHVKSFAALIRAFMVKGVASDSSKLSDFKSNMDSQSVKLGFSYKSRSSFRYIKTQDARV
ncbi:hypothetical protein TNIN_131171 [Trichonephila inaurata madagascariensis]|uniref:Uncharacterized protein n=1 Tax=Trichonephila inaurata madagascariensis TaxID=2747483 RepID=A0A8X6MGM2_9ARAC|nr:hypothetical protein TNIN_131171 [Trichonephila inaurata madagascariensis]